MTDILRTFRAAIRTGYRSGGLYPVLPVFFPARKSLFSRRTPRDRPRDTWHESLRETLAGGAAI